MRSSYKFNKRSGKFAKGSVICKQIWSDMAERMTSSRRSVNKMCERDTEPICLSKLFQQLVVLPKGHKLRSLLDVFVILFHHASVFLLFVNQFRFRDIPRRLTMCHVSWDEIFPPLCLGTSSIKKLMQIYTLHYSIHSQANRVSLPSCVLTRAATARQDTTSVCGQLTLQPSSSAARLTFFVIGAVIA